MLEWFTFGAAALAAIGTIVGPVIAYKSVTKTAAADRLQSDIDRYISLALEPDTVACRLGISQLQYLHSRGNLADVQLNAVSEAITAGLRRLLEEVESDPDAIAGVELTEAADILAAGEDTEVRNKEGAG